MRTRRFLAAAAASAAAALVGIPRLAAAAEPGPVVAWPRREGFAVPPSLSGSTGGATAIAAGGGMFRLNPGFLAFPYSSFCAIRADSGGVLCWTYGTDTAASLPPAAVFGTVASPPPSVDGTLGTASSVVVGVHHGCAIQTGTNAVICWGYDPLHEELPPPSVDGTLGGARALAASHLHTCAIQADSGAVVCWGDTDPPPPSVDGTAGSATSIAAGNSWGAGYGFTCAIQAATSAVVCWGANNRGQSTPPASVDGSGGTAAAIAAGAMHACAIQAETSGVVCWGDDSSGQASPPPSVDGTAGTAAAIAAGYDHTCAIQSGTRGVVCWGAIRNVPSSVDGVHGRASALAAAASFTLAIQVRECSDGVDTDGDLATDFPADPGCESESDTSERSTGLPCDDGNDDDGDGVGDFPLDPGCDSPTDGSERSESLACDDGADSDGDGLSDFPADPGCEAPGDGSEQNPDHVCDDGIDNDGDGRVDFPDDLACTSPTASSERVLSPGGFEFACDDDYDNDGDGRVSFPADPGCESPEDGSERSPDLACDDGLDTDGDGRSDHPADPGCDSPTDPAETSPDLICDDGLDNDGDGGIDHPGDADCRSPDDPTETSVACSNGVDDDGDGAVDHPADPGCSGFEDDSERGSAVCDDGLDNDGDGAADHPRDPDCRTSLDPTEHPVACSNGVDDDGDEAIDFPADPGCSDPESTTEQGLSVCDDGLDNDGDDLVDFPADPGCKSFGDERELSPTWVLEEVQVVPEATPRLTLGSDGDVYGTFIGRLPLVSSGSIFKIDAAGAFVTLHTFERDSGSRLVVGSDGALYGTTCEGCGQYFTYAPSSVFRIDGRGSYGELVTLPIWAASPLVLGSDGELYGALGYDDCTFGDCVFGNLYKVSSTGALTIFPGRRQGALPTAVGSDGAVYGRLSGWWGSSIFRLDPAGNYSEPHPIDINDGHVSKPVLGTDGLLYDVLSARPAVIRFDATHAERIPVSESYIGELLAPLVVGSDGAVYGVARGGAFFRIGTDGDRSFLTTPAAGSFGFLNQALMRARDGRLYATRGDDIVSRTSSANIVVSYQFAPPLHARSGWDTEPLDPLVQGNDCALYGSYRDLNGNGRVFRLFEPGHLCQRIGFEPLPDRSFGEEPFTLDAGASSTLPVSFTADGSCTVSGDRVTLMGGGSCTVTASQPGDARFGPANSVSRSFNVRLDFEGFRAPVRNPPAVTRATAGQVVPVRFDLGADAGRGIFAPGSPTVREVSCASGEPRGEAERAQAGKLVHQSSRYLFLWRTDRRWAGTCRELSLELVDGSVHEAYFRFSGKRWR